MFVVILMLPVVAVCQDGGVLPEALNIEGYFVSLAALAAAVVPVTGVIKRLLKSSGDWTKYISWGVAVGLAFAGWYLGLGMLAGLEIIYVVAYGVAAGLVANSVFDIKVVKAILNALVKRKKPVG